MVTPTKEVPTWEELVERLAGSFYEVWKVSVRHAGEWDDADAVAKEVGLKVADAELRRAGLTPEILEDARAVAWVEAKNADASRIEHLGWAVSMDRGRSFCEEAPTLREAVAKAKEEGDG